MEYRIAVCLLVSIAACRISDRPFIGLAQPRLIAPTSLAVVTQQRPTLRWELGPGGGAPVVELCKDRACNMPLPITVELAGDQRSAVPVAALPAGWVYWRVYVAEPRPSIGAEVQTVISATWGFWVGARSASTPVDTSHAHRIVLDANGDGYADFLVGSTTDNLEPGKAHVYLGAPSPDATGWNGAAPARRIDLTSPTGIHESFGGALASVGDVNGDGYGDFIVGDDRPESARLYLGSATPGAAAWNAASSSLRVDLGNPGNAFSFGRSLAGAGDINGDGYADFLIGAFEGRSPVSHVYLGAAALDPTDWNASSSAGRLDLIGLEPEENYRMAAVGDVNRDGYADFAIAGSSDGPNMNRGAQVYLGSASPRATDWATSAARRIAVQEPVAAGPVAVQSIAGVGDLDGDGYADFVVRTMHTRSLEVISHIYLGMEQVSTSAWDGAIPRRIDVRDDEAGDFHGSTSNGIGDINGDGYGDFLVASTDASAVHVYFGSAAPSVAAWTGPSSAMRADLADPTERVGLFGVSATGVGDVDGDGYGEFVVGASLSRDGLFFGGPVLGAAYVYLGSATASATTWNGASASQRIDLVNPFTLEWRFGTSVASSPPARRAR